MNNFQIELAINGGAPVRIQKMPARKQFNKIAREAVEEVFSYYESEDLDFGSQGEFEQRYCESFSKYINPEVLGYADVVCSGTAAIYVALLALELEKNSEVLISSITDPGMVNPVIIAGLVPKLVDNQKGQAHPSLEEIKSRMSSNVKAIVLNHLAGKAVPEIEAICQWAKQLGIKVIEDVSQAHGAHIKQKKLGSFGDIACFSTMYSKNHSTGGRGGVLYTTKVELYNKIRMYADKGKPFHQKEFNPKDPNQFLFPALNLNIDEVSCAIGLKSLHKLDETILKRKAILVELKTKMSQANLKTSLLETEEGDSPFFGIFRFDASYFKVSKQVFATAILKEGISLNCHYPYVVSEWSWVRPYLADNFMPQNALSFRDKTFNLLFNENFTKDEINDIVTAIKKVETYYGY